MYISNIYLCFALAEHGGETDIEVQYANEILTTFDKQTATFHSFLRSIKLGESNMYDKYRATLVKVRLAFSIHCHNFDGLTLHTCIILQIGINNMAELKILAEDSCDWNRKQIVEELVELSNSAFSILHAQILAKKMLEVCPITVRGLGCFSIANQFCMQVAFGRRGH